MIGNSGSPLSLRKIWLTWMGIIVFLMIGPGLVHFILAYQHERDSMQENAALMRRHLEQLIIARPALWEFEQHRLDHLLSYRKIVPHERIRVLSFDQRLLTQTGGDLQGPLIVVREPLHDGARVAGWLEVQRNLYSLLPTVGWTILLSLLLGVIVYVMAVRMPLRLVSGVTQQLQAERDAEAHLRHLAEARLKQAEKLEAIGTLAGGMAHSLNNILMPITLLGHSLLNKTAEGSRDRESLRRICDAADRAKNLVANVLVVGRQGQLQIHPVMAQSLLRQVEILVRQTLPEQLTLSIHLPTTPLWINIDPTQTVEALLNLTNNSVDALNNCQDGGEIRLGLSLIPADNLPNNPSSAGQLVGIIVEDNGPGMSPDIAQRALEPFFTTKPVGKGTGLGLYTVYNLVRTMGGDMVLESQPDQGTIITILLPLCPPASTEEPIA